MWFIKSSEESSNAANNNGNRSGNKISGSNIPFKRELIVIAPSRVESAQYPVITKLAITEKLPIVEKISTFNIAPSII